MLFSSTVFIFRFLILFMIVYLLVPARMRNAVLFAGSVIFYGAGEPSFVFILLISIVINYVIYVEMGRNRRGFDKQRRFLLIAMLLIDFGTLFVFKYWDFTAGSINVLTGHTIIPLMHLALPLGISFYTFQMVSLQVDLYRAVNKEENPDIAHLSFLDFATYIIMFPQLVAGPILQYDEVSHEMKERTISAAALENGFKLFAFGLGIKVLLANQIGTLWSTICGIGTESLSVPVAWLGAFAYSFQIYFDFWGYSLMAMGLGEMLGFHFPENFHNPYLARTMSEFWRRWHITLGRWFKEYVYFPMGGSRVGKWKALRNVFVVWALTGLWHGASWNFVLWGLTFFVLISLEKNVYGKYLSESRVLGHIYMIVLIPVTWVIFAITNIQSLGSYLRCMIGFAPAEVLTDAGQFLRYLRQYGVLLAFCVLFSTGLPILLFQRYRKKPVMVAALVFVIVFSSYEIANGSSNPFLYFRF